METNQNPQAENTTAKQETTKKQGMPPFVLDAILNDVFKTIQERETQKRVSPTLRKLVGDVFEALEGQRISTSDLTKYFITAFNPTKIEISKAHVKGCQCPDFHLHGIAVMEDITVRFQISYLKLKNRDENGATKQITDTAFEIN